MKKGRTLLHRVCRNGNDDSIDLIERVCDAVPGHINAKDDDGQTPLHWWSEYSRIISIGRCLLKNGADINAKDKYGMTPIMFCAKVAKHEKVIEFLLEQEAETHHKDKRGKDLLYYCKENGFKRIEALLLSRK